MSVVPQTYPAHLPIAHRALCLSRFVRSLCLVVLLDTSLDGLGVCADNLADLLAVLEEYKCGHGADAEFLRNVGDLVDVELVETCLGVLL
jgi:hypothetical protein